VALEVLADLKHVLKEDAGLDLNISKTSVLPKSVTQQVVFDVAHIIINNNPTLTPLNVDGCLPRFFLPEGFVQPGIGAPSALMLLFRNLLLKHVG
jgi:hypothetical protein